MQSLTKVYQNTNANNYLKLGSFAKTAHHNIVYSNKKDKMKRRLDASTFSLKQAFFE